MLLKKFRETGPDVIILILFLLLLTWTGAFLHPQLPSELSYDVKPMPLFGLLLGVTGFNPLFSVIVAFLLQLLISFLLVNFNTSVFFISERTYLPAVTYILLTGFFPQHQVLSPLLPAAVFLILAVRRIMGSYKIQGTAFSFFDAGMLISTGSLFYANLIWFGLLLIIGIAIIRTGSIREIIISVLGLATPIFIVSGFFYIAGKDMNSLLSAVTYNLFAKEMHYSLPVITLLAIILSAITVLISVTHLLSVINAKKIKSRKTFMLLFWTFFIAAAAGVIFKSVSVEIFYLAAIPVSYFLSHYFVFTRKKILPEVLLAALFIMTAVVQIANLIK
jgi:hypothetical protein